MRFLILLSFLLVSSHCLASPKETTTSIEDFKRMVLLAEGGDAHAQYSVGKMYLENQVVHIDTDKANHFLFKAVEQNHIKADVLLGKSYFGHMQNAPKTFTKAFTWCIQKATKGNAAAQNKMGFLYYTGVGVKENLEKAFYWYQKAAKQGHSSAQASLGHFYSTGLFVKHDYAKSFIWYKKAANQGFEKAYFPVAMSYDTGLGTQQDDFKAIHWYTKACALDYGFQACRKLEEVQQKVFPDFQENFDDEPVLSY